MNLHNPSRGVFIFSIFLGVYVLSFMNVSAISLGVAPGILNVGDVYPGTSKLVEFYLITTASGDMIVTMSPIEPHFDFYSVKHQGAYTFLPVESSNEDVRSWIHFPENPVTVSPKNIVTHTFPGGEKVRANKVIRAIMTVPADADPGYHVGSINFSPKIVSGGGNGVATMAITRFLYVFYVKPLEGQPEPLRKGRITDIEAYRADDSRVRIDVVFQNTGTDTLLTKISDLKIYDNFGNLQKKTKSGYVRIGPKETKVLSAFWNNKDAVGIHRVQTNVDFITGAVTSDTEVTIPETIFAPSAPGTNSIISGQSLNCPWWLIIIFVVMLAMIAYFKSDWVWILVILALIVGVLLILGLLLCPPKIDILSIPWWLVIVVIAAISLVVYWKS